jgi:hypothetical protein
VTLISRGINQTTGQFQPVQVSDTLVNANQREILLSPPRIKLALSSDATIPDDSFTAINWDIEVFNVGNWTTTTVDSGLGIVVPAELDGAIVQVASAAEWVYTANAGDRAIQLFQLNSLLQIKESAQDFKPFGSITSSGMSNFINDYFQVSTGDIFYLKAGQNSGAGLDLNSSAGTAGKPTYILIFQVSQS